MSVWRHVISTNFDAFEVSVIISTNFLEEENMQRLFCSMASLCSTLCCWAQNPRRNEECILYSSMTTFSTFSGGFGMVWQVWLKSNIFSSLLLKWQNRKWFWRVLLVAEWECRSVWDKATWTATMQRLEHDLGSSQNWGSNMKITSYIWVKSLVRLSSL